MKDANGQSLAYCYGRETQADADIAKVLTMDNARRIAANVAKLPPWSRRSYYKIPQVLTVRSRTALGVAPTQRLKQSE